MASITITKEAFNKFSIELMTDLEGNEIGEELPIQSDLQTAIDQSIEHMRSIGEDIDYVELCLGHMPHKYLRIMKKNSVGQLVRTEDFKEAMDAGMMIHPILQSLINLANCEIAMISISHFQMEIVEEVHQLSNKWRKKMEKETGIDFSDCYLTYGVNHDEFKNWSVFDPSQAIEKFSNHQLPA